MKSKVFLAVMAISMVFSSACAKKIYIIPKPATPAIDLPDTAISAKDKVALQKQEEKRTRRAADFAADQPHRQAQLRLVCPNPIDREKVVINDVAVHQGALVNRIFVQVRTTVPLFNGRLDID